jgi:phosphate transport system permease protein
MGTNSAPTLPPLVLPASSSTRPQWAERGIVCGLCGIALTVIGIFVWILGDLVYHGASVLSLDFLVQSPLQAGRAGGISTVLVGTSLIVGVAIGTALPIGLGTAILLAESSHATTSFGRVVRRSLDVLAGIPSIVFGLFGLAFFGPVFGWSILSGGLTLACMILPVLIRSTEESLRAVPAPLRQGAAALGLSQPTILWHLTLPVAAPGITAGLVLSIGRALAETAALLFTAGAAVRMPTSLFDSSRSLSYHIYLLAIEVPGGQPRAYAVAVVLIGLLLVINGVAVVLMRNVQQRVLP